MELALLRIAIADRINEYLDGRLLLDDLIEWANDQRLDRSGDLPQSLEYWIAQAGLWAIRMLGPSEPEEYRTTREDLLMMLGYLRGEVPFPMERIPADNLKSLRLETAAMIENYLRGQLSLDELGQRAASSAELLEHLGLPDTVDSQVIRYALGAVLRTGQSPLRRPPYWRRNLELAVRFLNGTVPFPKVDSRALPPRH